MSVNILRPGSRILTLGDMGAMQIFGKGQGAANWWDPNNEDLCVWAAYQPKGAASLAASYTDLSGNGNDCFPGVAPTWTAADGWIFDSSQYLETTFVPQNDQSQAVLIQYSNGVTANKYLFTTADPFGDRLGCKVYELGTNMQYFNGGTLNGAASPLAAGNICISGNTAYLNGVAEPGSIPAYSGTPVNVLKIGTDGGGTMPMYVQAFAIYYCTLTADQVAAVAAAMAAL